jgi:hypothetical protein
MPDIATTTSGPMNWYAFADGRYSASGPPPEFNAEARPAVAAGDLRDVSFDVYERPGAAGRSSSGWRGGGAACGSATGPT